MSAQSSPACTIRKILRNKVGRMKSDRRLLVADTAAQALLVCCFKLLLFPHLYLTMLVLACSSNEAAGTELASEVARRHEAERRANDLEACLADADAAQAAAETPASHLQAALSAERDQTAALQRTTHYLKVVRRADRREALKR